MKRLLLVTDVFPPDIGGPATFIPALAAELTGMGHSVTVICRSDNPRAHRKDEWKFPVVRLARRCGRLEKIRNLARFFREARRHDVIFSNGLERTTEKVCRWAGKRYSLKVVGDVAWERARNEGWTQSSIDEFQESSEPHPLVQQLVSSRNSFAGNAHLVITPSDYLRRLVIGWGVAEERVTTIRNGIQLARFARFAPRRRESVARVVFVGRLVNWKGLAHLVEAVAPLEKVHLTIVGDGPERQSLETATKRLGLGSRVDFKGALNSDGVLQVLETSHILALPSEYEGLSHTLLEACAAGLPCVASDRGGNPEVIQHERSGLLVPYGDVSALRGTIHRLASDEDFRFALAQGAKLRSKEFDFRATVTETTKRLLSS